MPSSTATAAPRRPGAAGPALALVAALALAPASSAAAGPGGAAPPPAAAARAGSASLARPGQGDKCPVCGMFVSRYPDWVATVTFRDGATAWFDGAKDLFKFLLHPERYQPGRRAADVERVQVTDYYALSRLDARDAWFVIGSDVLGPMGIELIPFAREADAREFQADHRGAAILRFGDVGPATLRKLQEPDE